MRTIDVRYKALPRDKDVNKYLKVVINGVEYILIRKSLENSLYCSYVENKDYSE